MNFLDDIFKRNSPSFTDSYFYTVPVFAVSIFTYALGILTKFHLYHLANFSEQIHLYSPSS